MSYQAPLLLGESSHSKYNRNTVYVDDAAASNPDRDFNDFIFSIKAGNDAFLTGPLNTQSNAGLSATTITVDGTSWPVVQFNQFQLIVNNQHNMTCRWKRDANRCSRLLFVKTDLTYLFGSWAYCTDVVEDYTAPNIRRGTYNVYLQDTNSSSDCNCTGTWRGAGSNARIKIGTDSQYTTWNVNT
tara:strand:- start:257 stop:811 length:555 start_codon:yes stop_codon:yes gene_type:complete